MRAASKNSAGRPAAVLWDMDGTLVDTEPYWIATEYALVAEFGGRWTDDYARSLVGFDLRDALPALSTAAGCSVTGSIGDTDPITRTMLKGIIAKEEEQAKELTALLAARHPG